MRLALLTFDAEPIGPAPATQVVTTLDHSAKESGNPLAQKYPNSFSQDAEGREACHLLLPQKIRIHRIFCAHRSTRYLRDRISPFSRLFRGIQSVPVSESGVHHLTVHHPADF
jgi:hypothetical protein